MESQKVPSRRGSLSPNPAPHLMSDNQSLISNAAPIEHDNDDDDDDDDDDGAVPPVTTTTATARRAAVDDPDVFSNSQLQEKDNDARAMANIRTEREKQDIEEESGKCT
jgi:hypothetical protein